jgi:hypothetical protein
MGETNMKADSLVRSKMVESADGGWQCGGIIINQSEGIESPQVPVIF